MSLAWSAWAWHQDVDPRAKLVLLALADRTADGLVEQPDIGRVAAETSMSEDGVRRCLRTLAAAGLIEKIARFTEDGGNDRNDYRLGRTT